MLFSYNILKLPCGVTSATSGSLTYTYLYDGTKVSALKSDGSGKRYVGSMVYSVPTSGGGSEVFESASWDEGRIGFTKSGSTYTLTDLWFVNDHLGNVRSVVDVSPGLSSPQVVERNDYLPYGTRLSLGNAVLATNRYRLACKEEQVFGGLDLGKVDFVARQYDPFTAGWTTIDPMAFVSPEASPYSYCLGDPIGCYDPLGLTNYSVNGETTQQPPEARYGGKATLKRLGLVMIRESSGSQKQIKIEEKYYLYYYYFQNGHLPPGNSIFR